MYSTNLFFNQYTPYNTSNKRNVFGRCIFKKKKTEKTKGVWNVSNHNHIAVSGICDCQLHSGEIPLGLTASICALGLTLTGILDVSTTFSQYVNSNVILCVGMFVVGQALFETGMANKIGGLVTRFAKTEKTLIIAYGNCRRDVRILIQHRNRCRTDPGCLWNRRRVRLFQKPPADAACICGSPRRKPLYHRSAGKFDGRQCTAGDGNQNQLFHVRAIGIPMLL